MNAKSKVLMALLAGFLATTVNVASAEDAAPAAPTVAPGEPAPHGEAGKGDRPHRKGEVNRRMDRQKDKIRREVKQGDITKQEAGELRSNLRDIKQDRREMAQDGISKEEHKQLNQELNQNRRDIRDAARPDGKPMPPEAGGPKGPRPDGKHPLRERAPRPDAPPPAPQN